MGQARLRVWGLVGVFLALGLGLGGLLWERRMSVAHQALVEAHRQVLLAIDKTQAEAWLMDLRLRASFIERLLDQPFPPALLRQTNIRRRLETLERDYKKLRLPISGLRAVLEQFLQLERRWNGWRSVLGRSLPKDQLALVWEQYRLEAPGLVSEAEAALDRLRQAILQNLEAEEAAYAAQRKQVFYGMVGGAVLLLLGVGVILWRAGRGAERQVEKALKALRQGNKLTPLPEPLAPLAEAYNQLLIRWQATLSLLEAFPENVTSLDEELQELIEPVGLRLQKIQQRLAEMQADLASAKAAHAKETQAWKAEASELRDQIERLRLYVGALQNVFPLAEADEAGQLVFQNDLFQAIAREEGWQGFADLNFSLSALESLRRGLGYQGYLETARGAYVVYLLPYRERRSALERTLVAISPVNQLAQQKRELELALRTAQERLASLEHEMQALTHKLSRFEQSHKQEIERLLRQRESLMVLLRHPALQTGEVMEGLSAITEVAASVESEARFSFWVIDEAQSGLHCLERYDPVMLLHSNTVDLPAEAVQWVLERVGAGVEGPHAWQDTPFISLPAPASLPHTVYLFPLTLDEKVIGSFVVELLREGSLRDKDFLMILSRVASLLFQQGHRHLIEKQLLASLDENQALVEELRQNIEELEASAEEMRRTQAELRGQIQALNAAALVAELRPDGTIIYTNEAFQRLFGLGSDKLLGRPYAELRSPEERPVLERMFARLRQGETWQEVVCYRNAFGEALWLQQTITPVTHVDKEIHKLILVGFDITLQKQQEQEIQRALELAHEQEKLLRENSEELRRSNESIRTSQLALSAQLEALNNAAWLFETDAEGSLTYLSPSFLECLGYEEKALKSKHYGVLFSERQPLVLLQGHWRSMQQGQVWKAEVELKGALGQTYWAILSSTPLLDPRTRQLLKTINILVDITEQKEQEFRLKEQQNALSQLAAHPVLREGNIEKSFQVIAQIALQTFKATRVSLWLYEESDLARCVAVAEKEPHSHEVGTVINRSLYPLYFQSLELEQVIAVTDALSDLRTRELALPLFKPNHVMSVLDAVIRVGNRSVGLISVEQRYAKREWRLDEVNFIRALAASAASVIEEQAHAYAERLEQVNRELAQRTGELEEALQNIQESIKYARRIQRNIVPSDRMLDQHLGRENYFIIWRPKERNGVGGDFYWFAPYEDRYFIVVADGTGHGVPGAFMTLIGSIFLDHLIHRRRIWEPAQILHDLHIEVRQTLKQDIEEGMPSRDGMDIALVVYFPKTYKLLYAGANLPLYYCLKGPDLREIKPDKKSIGGEQLEEERFFTQHEVQLEPGDTFFLFTDGLVDQPGGPDGKRFGTKRLKEFILETYLEPSMPKRRALLNQRWKEWKDYTGDNEQVDDVTVWGIRVW